MIPISKALSIKKPSDVIEQVKNIGMEDADDLAVLSYIMQARIASGIDRINKYFSAMVAKTIKTFYAVADTKLKEMVFNTRVITVDVDNNGPGVLYVRMNELDGDITNEIPIPVGGGTGFGSTGASVKRIWYQASIDNTQIEVNIEEGYGKESETIEE